MDTVAEDRQLDAGSWFAREFIGERVPIDSLMTPLLGGSRRQAPTLVSIWNSETKRFRRCREHAARSAQSTANPERFHAW